MPNQAYRRLVYRGNFSVECVIDFGDALLSAKYPNGYREDVIIGLATGLRAWKLSYPALMTTAFISPPDAEPTSRADYVWNFYVDSKSAGNAPFILTCPRDGKDYLCYFPEDKLSYTLVDLFLRTSGLTIEQINVRGVNTLDDGSLGLASGGDEI